MEIAKNNEVTYGLPLFKIDLIVWKLGYGLDLLSTNILFKIDLIVWK